VDQEAADELVDVGCPVARNAPPFISFMQFLDNNGRKTSVPILLALALLDPDEHPVTIAAAPPAIRFSGHL